MTGIYRRLILLFAIVGLVSIFVTGCGRKTVAKVDGSVITRDEYVNRLENFTVRGMKGTAGELVLRGLIDEQLILRLAQEKGVAPTDQQVEERYNNKKKEQGFKEQLKAAGFTPEQYKQRLRVEQAVINIETKGVKVTDKDIKDFYNQNAQTRFTTPEYALTLALLTKDKTDADTATDLLKKGIPFNTVAERYSINKTAAQIPVVKGGEKQLPKQIQDAVFATPTGKWTKPLPDAKGHYLIFQVVRHSMKKTAPLKDVEYMIREAVMLEKGRRINNIGQDMADFRKKAKIDVDIAKYKDSLLKEESPSAAGSPADGQ